VLLPPVETEARSRAATVAVGAADLTLLDLALDHVPGTLLPDHPRYVRHFVAEMIEVEDHRI
jgi:hypothetical protein